MYKVEVKNSCSCFIKRGLPDVQEFSTKDAAKEEAESLLHLMENTFCQKHTFKLMEQFGSYTIYIKPKN